MNLDFNSDVPIYLQLKQAVEDDVINGIFQEDTQVPSTTEISLLYHINPATVGKGFNLLVDEGILYKKRGVGMFVTRGARQMLLEKRRNMFFETYVQSLLKEADRLGISLEEIITMLKRGEEK